MKKVIAVLFALGLVAQIGLFSAFAAPKVAVTSVKVSPASITLAAGNTGTLKAIVSPATATNKAVSWKSSNTAIATIDSKGNVTALSTGSATITCMASGKSAVCKATVVKPTTNAQILATYTNVMNKAKAAKPAYNKYEYQELPGDAKSRNIGGGKAVIDPLLKLAARFMTTKEDAKANPGVYTKGGDMHAFPVKNAAKGCLMNDTNAIKTAKFEKLSNGNCKITMILKDEKNPEHYISGNSAPSKTGGIFVPLSKSDVSPELGKWYVKMVISNPVYDMNYHDCMVTLVYNPTTLRVISVDQILYNALTLSGKVVGISANGTQVLIMHYNIFNVVY